jgi:5,5'-dehydrodivanillate O-demethylase oxygenase subunit
MPDSIELKWSHLEAVGPGTPAGRYLRLFWQPVLRIRDLAGGRAKPVEILQEKFTVYRGHDGKPYVTDFRCPHRGTQLSVGWVEGNALRCRYHGWKFDANGQCVEQPNEDRPFCQRVKLRTYPAREYVGLIFVYFGEGEPPPFRQYPDFDKPGVVVADPPEVLPCTFWNRLDNDLGHVPWVHRATALRKQRQDYLVMRRESVEETAYGYMSTRTVEGGHSAGPRYSAYFFMPNARQFWAPTRAKGFEKSGLTDTKMTWTVPVNDAKFAAFDVTHTPVEGECAEAYMASRLKEQEAEAETRWDLAEKAR